NLDGLPVHIADTAGLRDSKDPVELEGMRRARAAMLQADAILLVVDARNSEQLDHNPLWQELRAIPDASAKMTLLLNKIDLLTLPPQQSVIDGVSAIWLSARAG